MSQCTCDDCSDRDGRIFAHIVTSVTESNAPDKVETASGLMALAAEYGLVTQACDGFLQSQVTQAANDLVGLLPHAGEHAPAIKRAVRVIEALYQKLAGVPLGGE